MPTFCCSSSIAATSFLISPWAMSRASRISASVTPLAPASTIRIASSVPATIRSRSSSSCVSSSGLTTNSPSSLPIADGADVLGDRDRRDRQRRGGAVHRQDVVGVDLVDRHRDRDQLGLVVPALGEERADRPVDHARGQRRLLAGFALATEERAGDLARGVHPLLDVDGEGKEVHVAKVADRGGAEDHRVAAADDDRAARLLREFAGLEGNLAVADIRRDAGNVKHAHLVFYLRPPGWRPSAFRTLVLFQAESTERGRLLPVREPGSTPALKARRELRAPRGCHWFAAEAIAASKLLESSSAEQTGAARRGAGAAPRSA